MKNVGSLSSIEGRKLLSGIYRELRAVRQISGLACLIRTWRICCFERDLTKYSPKELTILHPLGFFSGTGLWMEEIVNRFYFSTVNSFVYFGAAVLLVLIGIRRFSDGVSDNIVIIGVAFEALMLMFMFVVMLFSPNDDLSDLNNSYNEDEQISSKELLLEVGEIATDLAQTTNKLDRIASVLEIISNQQLELIDNISKVAKYSSDAVAPNPELLNTMKETSLALNYLNSNNDLLNTSTENLKHSLIEDAVRRELERLLISKV